MTHSSALSIPETGITGRINTALVGICHNDDVSFKCALISNMISQVMTSSHQTNNFTACEIVSSLNEQVPYLKYHKRLCKDHTHYISAMRLINDIMRLQDDKRVMALEKFSILGFNPNMDILDDLPLEIAIKNGDVDSVKWLVKYGAILYVRGSGSSHVPNLCYTKGKLLKDVESINLDILQFILDKGAFGHRAPMALLLSRLYDSSKCPKLFKVASTFFNKLSFYWMKTFLGTNKTMKLMNEYDHKHRYFTDSLAILFVELSRESGYFKRCVAEAYPLVAHSIKTKNHRLTAFLIGLHDVSQVIDGHQYWKANDAYNINRHIEHRRPTNASCIIKLANAGLLELIHNYKFTEDDVCSVYAAVKHNTQLIDIFSKYAKPTKFTKNMFSLPIIRLYLKFNQCDSIKTLIMKYDNLGRFSCLSAYHLRSLIRTEYDLRIVDVYL